MGSRPECGDIGRVRADLDIGNEKMVESGQAPTNVVAGPFGGAALEELMQMVRDL